MSQNSYTSSIHQTISASCPTLSECRLHRSILDEFQDGVCVINLDTYKVLYLNEAARKIYNRPLSECTENPLFWLEAIVPEERETLQNTLATFLNTEGVEETHRSMPVKYHILHPSGEKRLIHHKFWFSGNEEELRLDSTLTDITELNQVEESLRSSQRFIEQIAELSPSVLYVYDLVEQRNAYINREVGETLGYTAQEMMDLGSSVLQTLMHPEDFAKLGTHYQQFFTANEGDAFEIEYRMQHRNGDWRWLISRETLFSKTADGKPKQLIGTATDITDRKRTEQALQESEARYRAFADAIPDLMFRQSADGVYLDFKSPSVGDLAVPPEVFLGKNMLEVLPPALAQQIQHHIDLAIATGTIQAFDYQLASLNGKLCDYEARIAPVDSNEVIGVIQDISHRKRSEAALRKSQQQLQEAQRIAHIGSWEFDAATQKISWSEELFRIYGLDPAQGEPVYTEFLKTFYPDDTELFLQAFNRALTEGISYDIDYRFFRSDGSLRYLNARGEAVCNEQGEVVSLLGTAMDITERKETEAALREREAFLRTLYENVEQAIFVIDVDEDGTFRYRGWNPAGERICGFRSSEALGKTPQELFGEEIGNFFNQRCNSCLEAGTSITYEESFIQEGIEKWALTTLNPLRNELGRVYRILGTGYDITLRKQTEAALREREAFLRMLYENVEQSIFVIDVEADGTFRNQGWNPVGERICGIPSEEAEGKTPKEVFGDEMGGILEQHYTDCLKAGSLITYEESFMNNGIERWSLTSLNPLRDELGKIYRILGTAYDITSRKQAEMTLVKQEQFLRSIWEGVAYQIYVLDVLEDRNFRFAAINPAVENHIVVKAEQLIGKTLVEAMPAEVVPVWRERYASCVEAGVTISFEEKVVHPNQETWYLTTLTPLRNTADEIAQIIITAIDISDRKRIELALQQSEAQYRDLAEREVLLNRLNQLIRNSLELETILQTFVQEVRNLFAADQSLFMWYRREWNPPAWEIVYEAKKPNVSSLLGVYPVEYIPQLSEQLLNLEIIRVDDVDAYSDEELREFFQKVGYQSVISLPILTAEGEIGILTCSCSKTKRSWLDSEIEILHAICDQLTIAINQAQLYIKSQKSAQEAQAKNLEVEATLHELQKAQSNLIQAEKMSSLGQLVAGVAHEINNPVNFIYGNLTHAHDYVEDLLRMIELYQQYYPQPAQEIAEEIEAVDLDFLIEDLPKLLASMKVGSERIKEIVKSLRTFSRLDESDMKAVDLHESIDSTLMILHHRLKPKSDYPGIQIIKNYAELPEVECYAGQLNQVFMNLLSNAIDALEERDKSRTPQEITAQPSTIYITTTLQQKRVKICISDNGVGIKDEVISRIFDPFYTTKPVGQGTGLGLSISYQIIVDRHRGNLYCTSVPGKGTEFIIEIPQQQQRF
jgi:PAS domain S-box-containing protein